jgi:hypothetical protein
MPEIQYIPGSCNIGKGEIRRRQLVALVGLFFTVVTLLTFSTVDTPTVMRLGIFFPLMVASVGFVQPMALLEPSTSARWVTLSAL